MRTAILPVPGLPLHQVLLFAAMSLLLVSCSENNVSEENELSATVSYEFAVAAPQQEAPAPGEDPVVRVHMEAGVDVLVKALFYVDEELHTQLAGTFPGGDTYPVLAPADRVAYLNKAQDAFV